MTPPPLATEGVSKWRQPTEGTNRGVPSGSLVTHLEKDRTWHPISRTQLHTAFLCCTLHLLSLLVEETNRYYHQYLDTLHNGPSPQPDITETKIFLVSVKIGHDI
jgi:hypothetical protein